MSRPRKETLNLPDRQWVARQKAEKLRAAAIAEAMELDSSLVGLLTGLGNEIRELRLVNERQLTEAIEQRGVTITLTDVLRSLTGELEALRSMRTQNGHAKDDSLQGDPT